MCNVIKPSCIASVAACGLQEEVNRISPLSLLDEGQKVRIASVPVGQLTNALPVHGFVVITRRGVDSCIYEQQSLLLDDFGMRLFLYHNGCCCVDNFHDVALMLPRVGIARSRAQTKPSIYVTLLRHRNCMIE